MLRLRSSLIIWLIIFWFNLRCALFGPEGTSGRSTNLARNACSSADSWPLMCTCVRMCINISRFFLLTRICSLLLIYILINRILLWYLRISSAELVSWFWMSSFQPNLLACIDRLMLSSISISRYFSTSFMCRFLRRYDLIILNTILLFVSIAQVYNAWRVAVAVHLSLVLKVSTHIHSPLARSKRAMVLIPSVG